MYQASIRFINKIIGLFSKKPEKLKPRALIEFVALPSYGKEIKLALYSNSTDENIEDKIVISRILEEDLFEKGTQSIMFIVKNQSKYPFKCTVLRNSVLLASLNMDHIYENTHTNHSVDPSENLMINQIDLTVENTKELYQVLWTLDIKLEYQPETSEK